MASSSALAITDGGNRRVLVTRPQPAATATARRLHDVGFIPVLAPLLIVRSRTCDVAEALDAVLVTSGNAIAALPPTLHGIPLLTVGDATAQHAAGAGFSQIHSADGDAEALAALARRKLPPGARLLLAAGAGQGQALAAALRQDGFRVVRRTAYTARPAARMPAPALHSLRAGHLHAALFLSAETARTFVRLLPAALHPALAGVQALAIGQPAADALALLPWGRVRVSVRPTLDQVLALL